MKPILAKDIMNTDVLTVKDDMTLPELADFLVEHEISGAPVVDSSGNLVGVVSLTDIAESASREEFGPDPLYGDFFRHAWEFRLERDEMNRLHIENDSVHVCEIMTPTVYTVPEDTLISDIARTMIAGRIHRLLVTRDNKVVGIITTLDMLRTIVERD